MAVALIQTPHFACAVHVHACTCSSPVSVLLGDDGFAMVGCHSSFFFYFHLPLFKGGDYSRRGLVHLVGECLPGVCT